MQTKIDPKENCSWEIWFTSEFNHTGIHPSASTGASSSTPSFMAPFESWRKLEKLHTSCYYLKAAYSTPHSMLASLKNIMALMQYQLLHYHLWTAMAKSKQDQRRYWKESSSLDSRATSAYLSSSGSSNGSIYLKHRQHGRTLHLSRKCSQISILEVKYDFNKGELSGTSLPDDVQLNFFRQQPSISLSLLAPK